MYVDLARPLYQLLIDFTWTDECQEAYDALKRALASAPILRSPNWDVIFHVHIDASNFAIGCVFWWVCIAAPPLMKLIASFLVTLNMWLLLY